MQGALHLEVRDSFPPPELIRESWDAAVERLGGSVYMTFDWCLNWWRHYGGSDELRLLLVYADDTLVAILPFYVAALRLPGLRFRVARLVGSNIPPKVFNPPVAPEHATQVLDLALRHLLCVERCDMISLGPVCTHQAGHIVAAARAQVMEDASLTVENDGVHSVFGLPSTLEEWFASLTKKERKNNRNRYDLSLLRKERAVTESFGASRVAFDELVELHAREWEQKGGTGHFRSWPLGEEYNREQFSLQEKRGRAEVLGLSVAGRTIACIYGYYFGGRYYAELMGRDLEPEWDKYNLGRTVLVRSLARAIDRQCTTLEAGLGQYDYKERLNAQSHDVVRIRCAPLGRPFRFKPLLFDFLRVAIRTLYHKIWYRRIRGRLPVRWRKPQARLWLRLDY